MANFSDYLEENILTLLLRSGTGIVKPTEVAICLCTTVPVTSDSGSLTLGTGVEVTNANGYSRQLLNPSDSNWSNPATGTQGECTNNTKISFGPVTTADWGLIKGILVTDNDTFDSGNALFFSALDSNKQMSVGDTFEFNTNELKILLQ